MRRERERESVYTHLLQLMLLQRLGLLGEVLKLVLLLLQLLLAPLDLWEQRREEKDGERWDLLLQRDICAL